MSDEQVPTRRSRHRSCTIMLLVLLLALVAILAPPTIYRILVQHEPPIEIWELSELAQRVEWYKQTYGEYPPPPDPEKTIGHLRRIYPKSPDPKVALAEAGVNLDQLDGRESLVFWLSDRPGELTGQRSGSLYSFDPRRLVDRDGDGWLEYTTRHGDYFALVDGKVVIESRKHGWAMTADEIYREFCRQQIEICRPNPGLQARQ